MGRDHSQWGHGNLGVSCRVADPLTHKEEQEGQHVVWAVVLQVAEVPQEIVLCKTTSELLSNGKSLRRRTEGESYAPGTLLSTFITMLLHLWDFFTVLDSCSISMFRDAVCSLRRTPASRSYGHPSLI